MLKEWLQQAVSFLVPMIRSEVDDAIKAVIEEIEKILEQIREELGEIASGIEGTVQEIRSDVSSAVSGVQDRVAEVNQKLDGLETDIGDNISQKVLDGALGSSVMSAVEKINTRTYDLEEILKELVSQRDGEESEPEPGPEVKAAAPKITGRRRRSS